MKAKSSLKVDDELGRGEMVLGQEWNARLSVVAGHAYLVWTKNAAR